MTRPLEPWTPGTRGKFVIEREGRLHHWRIDVEDAPHHVDATRALGITSIIDGDIQPDGTASVFAAVADIEVAAMMEVARPEMLAAGLHPLDG